MSEEDRLAIDERRQLIEVRARALAHDAVQAGEPWIRRLGKPPSVADSQERWLTAAGTVAAYRDRYRITSNLAVGGTAATDAQRADRVRALRAVREATRNASTSDAGRNPPAAESRTLSAP